MKMIKHYKIIETIGRGGMGIVYKAFDTVLERHVALKVMHSFLLDDKKNDERFMTEARAAARLVHPNVVTIYEVGKDTSGRYIAMEYVEGTPLSEHVAREGALTPDFAADIAMQILGALGAAHGLGILHRDIKAENILVTAQQEAKILDFGIAKITTGQGLTVMGDVLGTIEYMAPEQMMGEALDARSDLYAAGVVLYQMLTNRLPFTGDSPVAVLYKQLNEDPVPPSHFNSAVDQQLDEIVLHALHKHRDERWGSAEEFRQALETWKNRSAAPSAAAGFETEVDLDAEDELKDDTSLRDGLFVGREKELRRLIKYYRSVQQSRGRTIILRGEAGVGKSTLANIFQAYARRRGACVLYGACLYQEGMDSYLPYVDALRKFFASDSFTLPEDKRAMLKTLVRERAPLLLAFTERFSTNFDGEIAEQKQFRAAHQTEQLEGIHILISTLATIKPVVLVIDDLQWADEASLHLFHYLAWHLESSRILLVGITRTDRHDLQRDGKPSLVVEVLSRMERESVATAIDIKRFNLDECTKLIDEALEQCVLSEEFYQRLYRETRGNPFIVLETLKNLQASGGLFNRDGVWYDSHDGLKLEIPERVEDVFVRRLNSLDDTEREVLQVAAVIGYKFNPSILSALLELPKLKLLKTLQKVGRDLELLVSTDDAFQFEHPMLRDLLYNEVPKPLRKEYHLMIADTMEQMYAPDYGAHVIDAALHFFRGGNDEKAIPLLFQAAERAFSISAFNEAYICFTDYIAALERSEAAPPEGAGLGYVYLRMGICLEELGRYEQALEAYEKLKSYSQEIHDFRGEVEAMRRLARVHEKMGNWDAAMASLESCLRILDEHPMPNFLSRIYNSMGVIYIERGEYELALQYLHKTTEVVDHEMGVYDCAHALTNIGIIHNIRGEHNEALHFYDKAMALYMEVNDERGQARIHHNMGMTYSDLFRWDDAIRAFQRCYELAEKLRDRSLRALALLNTGKAYARQRKLDRAEETTKKALKIFRRMDDKLNMAEAYHILGIIASESGDCSRAARSFNESIKLNRTMNYQEGLAETYLSFADHLSKVQNPERAAKYLEAAEQIFSRMNIRDKLDEVRARKKKFLADEISGENNEVVVVNFPEHPQKQKVNDESCVHKSR